MSYRARLRRSGLRRMSCKFCQLEFTTVRLPAGLTLSCVQPHAVSHNPYGLTAELYCTRLSVSRSTAVRCTPLGARTTVW
eukprot:2828352-Prymnesium_polylepis.2